MASGHHMWGGRFIGEPSEAMAALNNSLSVDRRLWRHDIQGSKAWVKALRKAAVLTTQEEQTLLSGLDRVATRIESGDADAAPDEDIHTLVERMLFEEIGDLAGKLHTGRSRNDQVVTDLRLWCLEALDAIDEDVRALGNALVAQAAQGVDLVLPGYTHGQQAQPVRWAFVLLSHAWPLVRDRQRIAGIRPRVATLPLGSGAVAGSGIAIDRAALREELRFDSITSNALDATGDRDFVVEVVFTLAMIATHLSRLGGEFVTYSSSEYGFIQIADAYSTGSSLLPQKRNPDVFELARAKAARTIGDLLALFTTMHGLPSGYSKDLQEDKPALFDAVDTLTVTLRAMRGAVETLRPRPDRMRAALRDTLFATDVADMLVQEGVPFRAAHGFVGRLVRLAEERQITLTDVSAADAVAIHPSLSGILGRLGDFEDSVDRRVSEGGTSRSSVLAQIGAIGSHFRKASAADSGTS